MKKSSLALLLATASAGFAQSPPDPNLTFDTDDFIRDPKYTISVGYRGISGAKASFSGNVHVQTALPDIPQTGTDGVRNYSDGSVGIDTRTVTNPDGTPTTDPITPDGKTNTWSYQHARQAQPGTIAMHSYAYSADVLESGLKGKEPSMSYGVEVAVRRDMNKISTRFDWAIFGGISVNDLRSQADTSQRATITTMTDLYAIDATSADGQPSPPAAPYSAPSSRTLTVTNSDGTTTTTTIDTTTLLSSQPIDRTLTTAINTGALTNHWRLKGSYYTFRAGPTIVIPISERWRATFSLGGALVYAGTTYSVEQEFIPDDGVAATTNEVEDATSRLLPGYYGDANVEYWLTERAGFYVGAVHQSNGSYNQTITTATGSYTTKIDLSSMQGFRMGMNIRF